MPVLAWSKGVVKDTRKTGSTDKVDLTTGSGKFPALRRRKHIFVISLDLDNTTGIVEATRKIFEAVEKERTEGSIGFILSTSMTISEIHSFLVSGGFKPNDFDAFICNSGSDLYYSTLNAEDGPFVVDFYYHSHIEYRWGGEGLRKTLVRWVTSVNDKKAENEDKVVTAAEQLSTNYCYAFTVQKPGVLEIYTCKSSTRARKNLLLSFLAIAVDWDLGGIWDERVERKVGGYYPNIIQTTEDWASSDVHSSLEKLEVLKC
ncbi:hypothetical protein Patl1_13908 [Pistacia atlantica]|uniref:Uncharacterized protein n=1 Tax=Pistacia atlantica TaxID=434234 RepID=A0ACC1AT13_9ROSI|nr:hypothetical protein Patl1_13908 [Pistacia atlantica]